MKARLCALLAVLAAAGCGSQHAPSNLSARPGPALHGTARQVAAEGAGAHRLSLWLARNGAGDLCPGWRLGPGRPARFHCQRRGLERPVLWVEGGGGIGDSVTWGGDVGLVAPGVARVVTDLGPVSLRPVAGLAGWRVFAQRGASQPASSLDAYGSNSGQLLDDVGLWINPDGEGCDCGRNAAGWFGTYAFVPEQQRGGDARAIAAALAVDGVRGVLADHGPGWIDSTEGWQKCVGGTIGMGVVVKLWRPASYRATLPFEISEPAGTHVAYVSGVHRVYAIHSDELMVWVDTHSWRAVGVDTALESGIEIPLGAVSEPKPGGGWDDPSACPKGD